MKKPIATSRLLNCANLTWQNQVPVAVDFDDIYFNRDGGVDESRHVFIAGNRLAERFHVLTKRSCFVIAETGFGTGLNFLCTRELWLNTAPDSAVLHFISFEKHPIQRDDLSRLHACWPEFSDGCEQLLASYPLPQQGYHRLIFDHGRIHLTLIYGDLIEMLPTLDARIDAWFLDGFAPSRNPAMWHDSLFQTMARLSKAGTTLATFTVARHVRDGLTTVGFHLNKAPGFGSKLEMLTGEMVTDPMEKPTRQAPTRSIWFSRQPQPVERPAEAIIIGAGLAGATTARALAERGISVKVFERHSAPAQAGSGNPQGALYAKLSARPTAHSDFHLAGFQQATRLLAPLLHSHPDMVDLCGVLQLALTDKEAERQRELIALGHYSPELVQWVDQPSASNLASSEVSSGGLFFPSAGWVSPPAFCRWLLQHPLIELITDCSVQSLNRIQQGVQHEWMLETSRGAHYCAPVVVVCGAAEASAFEQLHHLPLKPIRGQTSYVDATPDLPRIKTVVCGDGYISPALHGRYCYGASFNLHQQDMQLSARDQKDNLDKLLAALPGFGALSQASLPEGRVGFRCTTPDYLPVVGPAPVYELFIEHYAKLRDDANWRFSTPASYHDGLFVNAGHGSKGLITCPISAELLAAQICNEPLPLERSLSELIHPARFIIKKLIRNQL